MPEDALGAALRPFLLRDGADIAAGPEPSAVADLLRDRAPTLVDMAHAARYFYHEVVVPETLRGEHVSEHNRPALQELLGQFSTLPWDRASIADAIKAVMARHRLKAPQVMMPLRILVAGTPTTPAIDAVLALLGRERTCKRLAAGLGT